VSYLIGINFQILNAGSGIYKNSRVIKLIFIGLYVIKKLILFQYTIQQMYCMMHCLTYQLLHVSTPKCHPQEVIVTNDTVYKPTQQYWHFDLYTVADKHEPAQTINRYTSDFNRFHGCRDIVNGRAQSIMFDVFQLPVV
jgi:hypothetical protein